MANTRPDPFSRHRRLSQEAGIKYFTDRERFIDAFRRHLDIKEGADFRVLVFYGVGGIGKSTLVRRLFFGLGEEKLAVPHAQVNLQEIGDVTQAGRESLLRFRTDLENRFGISFPRFDLCLAVLIAREGGPPPPLVRVNPVLKDLFDWSVGWVPLPTSGVESALRRTIEKFSWLERLVRDAGGTEDVIGLRNRALENDPAMNDELIRRFALDLRDGLPEREGKYCRCVLFLDTFESLWVDREASSATQARRLDRWVRELARYCLSLGVLLVISGRDRLTWLPEASDDPCWDAELDQHLIGGLSPQDSQLVLAKWGVGLAPHQQEADDLQRTIIACCDTMPGRDVSCHPLYLSLCAETVLNHRRTRIGRNPVTETFRDIPKDRVANELADRFLRSLHNRSQELWLEELGLTPRFNETVAFELAATRRHNVGRADWELITRLSFVEEAEADGFLRMHKTMRNVLFERIASDTGRLQTVHCWFNAYWAETQQPSLAFYHEWMLASKEVLNDWAGQLLKAIQSFDVGTCRKLIALWGDVDLDEAERLRLGDEVWASVHLLLGSALLETPDQRSAEALDAAADHLQAASRVWSRDAFPTKWAQVNIVLSSIYLTLYAINPQYGIQHAIQLLEECSMEIRAELSPFEWGLLQMKLSLAHQMMEDTEQATQSLDMAVHALHAKEDWHGLANIQSSLLYTQIESGNTIENRTKALHHVEAALHVFTEKEFPRQWAEANYALAVVLSGFPSVQSEDDLYRAMECCQAAMRVYTEQETPNEWARIMLQMCVAHACLFEMGKTTRLNQCMQCCNEALRVLSERDSARGWAAAHVTLGAVYRLRTEGDPTENHRQAVEHFQAAERVFTRTDAPSSWAAIQTDKALLYGSSNVGDPTINEQRAQAYFEAALDVLTRDEHPVRWADVHVSFGRFYANRSTGNADENHQKAIELLDQALSVLSTDKHPFLRAKALVQQGRFYCQVQNGNPDANLKTAIACFNAALVVYTRQGSPDEWAEAMAGIGIAQIQLSVKGTTDNLTKGIQYCADSLRVLSHASSPQDWAYVQLSLGIAHSARTDGNPIENQRKAVEYLQAAESVFTRTDASSSWAAIQRARARLYASSNVGDPRENEERAHAYFEAALDVYTYDEHPVFWASVQVEYSQFYANRPTGDANENRKKAIERCDRALSVFTFDQYAFHWAEALVQQGQLYCAIESGDRKANLNTAIACYESALAVYNRQSSPAEWASTHHLLGGAYWYLAHVDCKERLQDAIRQFDHALEVYTVTDHPLIWASLQQNIGLAHLLLNDGDRNDEYEKVVAYLTGALRVFTKTDTPRAWADTHEQLAQTHLKFYKCEPLDVDNRLKLAVNHFHAALTFFTETSEPTKWASLQDGMATAYCWLSVRDGDQLANLNKVVECSEAALRVYTQTEHLQQWALVNWRLATNYAAIDCRSHSLHSLEQAIACYQAALLGYGEAEHPEEWASIQRALGQGYFDLYKSTQDVGLLCLSEDAFLACLRVYKESLHPDDWFNTVNSLGCANFEIGKRDSSRLHRAIDFFRSTLRTHDEQHYPLDFAMTMHNLGDTYDKMEDGDRFDKLMRSVWCYRHARRVYQLHGEQEHITNDLLGALARGEAELAAAGIAEEVPDLENDAFGIIPNA